MDEKLKVEYRDYLAQLKKKAFIENKISSLVRPAVNNPAKTTPEHTLKPSLGNEDVLADIPPSRKKKDSVQPLNQGESHSRFQTFEEKLKYYRKLRNSNKISEGEYQKKKRELLNHF